MAVRKQSSIAGRISKFLILTQSNWWPTLKGIIIFYAFTKNEKVRLYVYNSQLQLHLQKEVQVRLHEYDDIHIIPFKGFYFLYVHLPHSASHELWKIDAEGNPTSVSELFMTLIETTFKKNTAELQLVNKNDHLFVIANTYYETLGKIGSTVTEADESLKVITSKKVFYDYKQYDESLKQVALMGDDLLILKTSKDSVGHVLQLIKANMNTGELVTKAFNSGSHTFLNPVFSCNEADSGILIYSIVQRAVFITKLDYLLNEKVPVTLLKKQFKDKTAFNFLLLQAHPEKWLCIHLPNQFYRINAGRSASTRSLYYSDFGYNTNLNLNNSLNDRNSINPAGMLPQAFDPGYNRVSEVSGVRFSILNAHFTVSKNSLTANDKSSYSIGANHFATAVWQNKSCLFLEQQFGKSRQGLLMVRANEEGELLTTDIRVYDKYEYLLPQLQSAVISTSFFPTSIRENSG